MALDTTAPPGGAASAPAAPAPRSRRRPSAEAVGYAVLAAGLFALLWSRASAVDSFYLDEWIYRHLAEAIADGFPTALWSELPFYERGFQRAYAALLAAPYGLFGAGTAFTLAHLLNVALLVSAIVPAALLARRVVASPWLRVLAVALAVVLPWLTVSAHLLTENLAFPLFLWVLVLSLRAAEQPSYGRQVAALAAVGLVALTRLNLASVAFVLVACVAAAEVRHRLEHRDEPLGTWIASALRRQAPVAAVTLAVGAGALWLLADPANLGWYGSTANLDTVSAGLFGDAAETTRRAMLTYLRAIVVGGFVFPFVLGLAAALAGTAGRGGRELQLPAVATLAALVATIVVVAIPTALSAVEERYAFYPAAPLAVMAVAAVERARVLRRWIAGAGAVAVWALLAGIAPAALNSGHFFAAPAGAFWTRVVDHRLRAWEEDLFGWMFIAPTGWLLIALAIAAVWLAIGLLGSRPRLLATLLAGGLALCVAAQAAVLDYAYEQELYGTTDAPGGIALSRDGEHDRETWLDPAVPDGQAAAVLPGIPGVGGGAGGTEALSFWNGDLDAVVGVRFNGSPVPAAVGYQVVEAPLGPEGLVGWEGPAFAYLAQHADDPRVQFAGQVVARSPISRWVLLRRAPAERALWTGSELEPDGAVTPGRAARLVLDRAQVPAVRRVELEVEAPAAVRWRVLRGGRTVARGRLAEGASATIVLDVPPCAGEPCAPVEWALSGTGPGADVPYPGYGTPQPRTVTLLLRAARIG